MSYPTLTDPEAREMDSIRRAYHARLVEIENHPQGYTTFGWERLEKEIAVRALTKVLAPYGYENLDSPFAVAMGAVLGTGVAA